MAVNIDTPLSPLQFHLRRLWQRWLTILPCRTRRFEELYPANCDYLRGIFRQRRLHTGVLHREAGHPFLIRPAQYIGAKQCGFASEDTQYWCREPDRIVFALSGAGVESSFGRVYDPASRSFIAETCENWDAPFDRALAFALPGFPKPVRLPGISIMLGSMAVQTFYHFFVEALPKLALYAPYLESCDHVLVSRYSEESKLRWLSLWGLEKKIIFVQDLAHYTCDQLLFTNRCVRHFEPGPWCVERLRSLPNIPHPPASLNPRGPILWLDRRQDHARQVDWESRLLARLPEVTPVRLGELAPAEAARTVGNARAILGLHGAAFSNMVFAPSGLRVIEIFTKPNYPWYSRLSQACGHNHTAIVAGEDPGEIDALASTLRSALAT